MTDANIQYAAYQWITNNAAALAAYGDIRLWDTSRVTNMDLVFGDYNPNANYVQWNDAFNADLSLWNTSQVTTMVRQPWFGHLMVQLLSTEMFRHGIQIK